MDTNWTWRGRAAAECPAKVLRKLETVLAGEPSIAVRKPPVAFGMKLWGRKPQKFPEFPEVWVAAAKETGTKLLIPPDDLFEHIWPDKSKDDAVGVASSGFVWQALNPVGGEIQRPKSWFYTESHRAPSYTWIVSREDASKGPYTTGMRIQMIVGVQEKTGKSPKEFVLDFAKKRKQRPKRLLSRAQRRTESCLAECVSRRKKAHTTFFIHYSGATRLTWWLCPSRERRKNYGKCIRLRSTR